MSRFRGCPPGPGPTAALLGSLIAIPFAGVPAAPAAAQAPPDFSAGNTVGWAAVGTEWTALPGSPPTVRQDPAHRYVPNNTGGQPTFRIADLDNPNLTPLAKVGLSRVNEAVLAGKPMWSPSARCWSTGPAFFLTPVQPMFFIQTPREVWIMAQHDNDVRRIYLDQPHSENPKPAWYGESVGHYEGDTLVVDTVAFNDRTFIDNFRTPHSDKLHTVERFRLVEGGAFLEIDEVIEDPAVFVAPLHVTKRSRRVEAKMLEWRCAAGEMSNPFADASDPIPVAQEPDF